VRVMGLDMSTKTGVAVVDGSGKVIKTEQVTFPKLSGMPRINAIVGRILELHGETKPDLLVVEDYAVGKFASGAIVGIELGGVLRFILWQEGIKYLPVAPTSVKKFVCGNGKAKKEQMMMEVYKRWGYTSETNDIADAMGLSHMGLAMLGQGVKCSEAMLICAEAAQKAAMAVLKGS
jgi:crossover junction endodeoxyribonuclease RuvC